MWHASCSRILGLPRREVVAKEPDIVDQFDVNWPVFTPECPNALDCRPSPRVLDVWNSTLSRDQLRLLDPPKGRRRDRAPILSLAGKQVNRSYSPVRVLEGPSQLVVKGRSGEEPQRCLEARCQAAPSQLTLPQVQAPVLEECTPETSLRVHQGEVRIPSTPRCEAPLLRAMRQGWLGCRDYLPGLATQPKPHTQSIELQVVPSPQRVDCGPILPPRAESTSDPSQDEVGTSFSSIEAVGGTPLPPTTSKESGARRYHRIGGPSHVDGASDLPIKVKDVVWKTAYHKRFGQRGSPVAIDSELYWTLRNEALYLPRSPELLGLLKNKARKYLDQFDLLEWTPEDVFRLVNMTIAEVMDVHPDEEQAIERLRRRAEDAPRKRHARVLRGELRRGFWPFTRAMNLPARP